MILYFFAVRTRVWPPSRFLHPTHLPRQIQTGMHRRHHHALGTAHGKRHPKVHLRLLQAHRFRRQRKAHRKQLAAARGGHGKAGKRHEPHRRNTQPKLSTLQKRKAMKKNNVWEIILKVIVAAITAALTAITTTSCMSHGPLKR